MQGALLFKFQIMRVNSSNSSRPQVIPPREEGNRLRMNMPRRLTRTLKLETTLMNLAVKETIPAMKKKS
jgi:hypothetical protein